MTDGRRVIARLFDDAALGITTDAGGVRRVHGKRGLAVLVDRMRLDVLTEAYAEQAARSVKKPARRRKGTA